MATKKEGTDEVQVIKKKPRGGKLYIERWARADGWKIGKQCRCPDCVKKAKVKSK